MITDKEIIEKVRKYYYRQSSYSPEDFEDTETIQTLSGVIHYIQIQECNNAFDALSTLIKILMIPLREDITP